MKKVNYYYLIVGFLAILFSITHELHGQQTSLPALCSRGLDVNTVTTFRYVWHIITIENCIFGITFIVMSFCRRVKNIRFLAWLICTILITRLFTIISTTLIMDGSLSDLSIDIIAIIVYVTIILLGTRVKD